MLAGSIYFYKNDELVKEIDMEDYDDLSEDKFMKLIEKLKADFVILRAYSHNCQPKPYEKILFKEKK